MSDYVEKIIKASGGHAAPAENLKAGEKEAPEGYHYMPDGTLMRDDAHDNEAASDNPCWDGYVQIGMKMKDGKEVPNCVPANEASSHITEKNQQESKEALVAAGYLIPEEQEFAKALLKITKKHGKFNADDTGVWAGYTPAAENDNKDFGVKCGSCIFWDAPNGCKIVEATTEEGGLCRLAVIPDGVVEQDKGEKPVKELFEKSPKLEQYEL